MPALRMRLFRASLITPRRIIAQRNLSTAAAQQKRSSSSTLAEIFAAERQKQEGQLRKMMVQAREAPDAEYKDFLMNQGVSTPIDVAKHISDHLAKSSAICSMKTGSLENMLSLWEPINAECKLDFVAFNPLDKELESEVHKAYFRSACILLAIVAGEAFNKPIASFTREADMKNSYFSVITKANQGENTWTASTKELSHLAMYSIENYIHHSIPFKVQKHPLHDFEDCKEDLSGWVDQEGKVTLCQVGKHVIPIDGPVIAHTGQIGRFGVVKADIKKDKLRLFGMSVPQSSRISTYIWGLLKDHAEQMAATK